MIAFMQHISLSNFILSMTNPTQTVVSVLTMGRVLLKDVQQREPLPIR